MCYSMQETKFSWNDLLNESREQSGYDNIPEAMGDIYIVIYSVLLIGRFLEESPSEEEQKRLLLEGARIREYVEKRYEQTSSDLNLPLAWLIEQLSLSEWQVFCILLGSFCMYAPQSAGIFPGLPESCGQQFPTISLAITLFQHWEQLSVEEYTSSLQESIFWELFFHKPESRPPAPGGLGEGLFLRPAVFRCLMGGDETDNFCLPFCTYQKLRDFQENIVIYQQEAEALQSALETVFTHKKENTIICLNGDAGSGRKFLVKYVSAMWGRGVLFADWSSLKHIEDVRESVRLLSLEGILKNAMICLTDYKPAEEQDGLLRELIRLNPFLFLTSEQAAAKEISRFTRTAEVSLRRPGMREKILLWEHFLKEYQVAKEVSGEYLGSRYVVNAGSVRSILKTASLYVRDLWEPEIGMTEIRQAVKQYQAGRLSGYAEPIAICYDWEDLVVDAAVEGQLRHICSRISQKNLVENTWGFGRKFPYGKGVCALFYGPPGTGKTMAVQVLAGEMGLDLYRIDLSRMLSKYIGETQKHITELFEMAGEMNALLFFDEADAFFSRRTEVSDAMDRHANGDVAQLLQKLEEYEGISVLATNLKDNIDNAFKRRIQYMVHFQAPDAATRAVLWKKQFPEAVPVEENLELAFFAKHFELSGSEIKNVVLTAAYMAAEQGQAVSNRHIMEALKLNYAKYGRILSGADFGELLW